MILSRFSSPSECRCGEGSNGEFTYRRVTSAGKSQCGEQRVHSDKAKSGAEHRDGARARVRLSNRSATNEQHELACKTTRRGVPGRRRRNPSPEQIDRSIHFGAAAESSHPRAWNSAERLNFTAASRGKPEWRPGKERTKAVEREGRGRGGGCLGAGGGRRGGGSCVTEGTIKRHSRRPGNSRYLKLRSQISNAENRC